MASRALDITQWHFLVRQVEMANRNDEESKKLVRLIHE